VNYVEVDIEKGRLVKAKTCYKSSEWAIRNVKDNTIYPFEIYEILEDGEFLIIDNRRISKKDVELITMDEARRYLAGIAERDVYKDVRQKILSPFEHTYGPFTEAVLVAILKDGENDFARSTSQHNYILSLIS